MSRSSSTSLITFSDKALHPLHESIYRFTGRSETWAVESDRARERAFAVRSQPMLFKYWYLRSQVLKRFQEGAIPASARREAALVKFYDLETLSGEVNARLADGWGRPWPEATRKLLLSARRIIGEALGPFHLDELPRCCGFSAGATTEQTREGSSAEIKWETATHVTASAAPYANAFFQWAGFDHPVTWLDADSGVAYSAPRAGERALKHVPGNEVFTVPKRFDTDRTCAKEPPWNVFFQKGVGTMIRRRLRSLNLLHPDAQETHANLAREASITGKLATVDMKGASDLVTLALVELLLPPDWLKVILDLRSPTGKVPGRGTVTYEKVSSMGNGYTFELETLIFWALARACCSAVDVVSVYGDDLICPAVHVPKIQRLFKFVGFEFNLEKSFAEGPFRESCGGHFWGGVDVKPFYVTRMPRSLLQIINLHNDILRWMTGGPVYHRLIEILQKCRQLVPREFWGPYGEDGCLWAEWDEARPRFVRGSRSNQPNYQHWRISTVRREVIVHRHDYYRGSLFADYWDRFRSSESRHQPWCRSRVMNKYLAMALRGAELGNVSHADFTYAVRREVKGWRAVGVASDWQRLPVRIA